jgi:hypothetical protein
MGRLDLEARRLVRDARGPTEIVTDSCLWGDEVGSTVGARTHVEFIQYGRAEPTSGKRVRQPLQQGE